MRFHALHKLASYLMAGCAFGAVALSDELNPLVVLAAIAGGAVSWIWEPPRVRPERWTHFWNAAAVLALGYTVFAGIMRSSWIIGTQFLVFLLVAKLFNRRASRDYQWIYVVSFLLLVAGSTLNAELSYAVCFIGYVIFSTWALILHHLRREMEDNFLLKHSDDSSSERVEVDRILNSRRIVGGKFLAGTSAVSLAIFVASSLLFLLFPRVGFGLFFQRNRSGVSMAGLNESGVTLGGHGRILDDDTVVMRVKVEDFRWRGLAAPAIHWRALAFDQYADGRWSRSGNGFQTKLTAIPTGTSTIVEVAHPFRDPPRKRNLWREGLLRQEIFLEPIDTTALLGASVSVGFELPGNVPPGQYSGRTTRHRNDDVRHTQPGGIRYTVYSDISRPDEELLLAAPAADRRKMRAYLQLPADLPERVKLLAAEITAGADGPYRKALAIEAWLRNNFSYTLELDTAEGREPLDYFLFDRKKGHCEYFATAEAVLLRAVGVPTRNVNGFAGGEWNEYGGYWAVRAGDAHSWVEVWIDGVGWITRDPTPPVATPLSRGGGDFLDRMRRMVDTMRLQWFKWVIEYDLGRQLNLFKDLGKSLGFTGKLSGRTVKEWLGRNKLWIAGAVLLVALAVALRKLRRRVERREEPAGRRSRARSHPIISLWARAAKKLARHGFPRAPAETPREHAVSLAAKGAPGADAFSRLTELYYTARFAEPTAVAGAGDVEAARALAARIESELARPSQLSP